MKLSQRKTNTVSFHLGVESKKLKWTNRTNWPIDTEKPIIARGLGGGGMGEKAKGIRGYKLVNKSWGCKVQHREY